MKRVRDKKKEAEYRRRWYLKHQDEHKARMRKYYWKNRKRFRSRRREWSKALHETNRLILQEAKKGGCTRCGFMDVRGLVFHHPDPAKKEYNVSQLVSRSTAKLLREIKKCVVLCGTCHLIVTSELPTQRGRSRSS